MASLEQFETWAFKTGRVANPNGSYPGQCVSLVQQYLYRVFGVPYKARGNAKDFVPPTFTKLAATTKLRPGDIVRYGSNYGGGYGHIGLICDDGLFLEQNGAKPLGVSERSKPWPGVESVWRPTKSFTVKTPVNRVATVTGAAGAFVRSQPTTTAPLAGSRYLPRGSQFNYTRIVTGQRVAGNNRWYQSTKGNYCWSGNVKG